MTPFLNIIGGNLLAFCFIFLLSQTRHCTKFWPKKSVKHKRNWNKTTAKVNNAFKLCGHIMSFFKKSYTVCVFSVLFPQALYKAHTEKVCKIILIEFSTWLSCSRYYYPHHRISSRRIYYVKTQQVLIHPLKVTTSDANN